VDKSNLKEILSIIHFILFPVLIILKEALFYSSCGELVEKSKKNRISTLGTFLLKSIRPFSLQNGLFLHRIEAIL
jgi:hypothetical protein